MQKLRILSIDDEENYFQQRVKQILSARWDFDTALTFEDGIAKLRSQSFDVLLLDKDLGKSQTTGLEHIPNIKMEFPRLIIIMLTYDEDFNGIVKALHSGASDYIIKSDTAISDLQIRVPECISRAARDYKLRILQKLDPQPQSMIGVSRFVHFVQETILQMIDSNDPILISGETGSGKETIAKSLWLAERDPLRAFYSIKLCNLTETSLINELFMPEGAIYLSHQGDLLLEGIEVLSIKLQKLLLDAVRNKEFKNPITKTRSLFDSRLICTTSEPPATFDNSDLFYKPFLEYIKSRHIHAIPLRERREDIPLISQDCLSAYKFKQFSYTDSALSYLKTQKWPGNISQLKNLIKACIVDMKSTDRSVIDITDILRTQKHAQLVEHNMEIGLPSSPSELSPKKYQLFMKACEKFYLEKSLDLLDYDVISCSKKLGLSRSTFYRKLDKLKLPAPSHMNSSKG